MGHGIVRCIDASVRAQRRRPRTWRGGRVAAILSSCVVLGSACGGSSREAASTDASSSEGSAPTLGELKEEIFVPSCVLGRCHTTRTPTGDMPLTGRRVPVYDVLVDVPSSQAPDRKRVVPSEPDASYLMEKLTATEPAVGEPMPPYNRLPDADIERIRRWIAAGAPR